MRIEFTHIIYEDYKLDIPYESYIYDYGQNLEQAILDNLDKAKIRDTDFVDDYEIKDEKICYLDSDDEDWKEASDREYEAMIEEQNRVYYDGLGLV